jgi:hypothetical protein
LDPLMWFRTYSLCRLALPFWGKPPRTRAHRVGKRFVDYFTEIVKGMR